MKFKQSLRRRIIFSFIIFAALLSLMITMGVHFALEDIEQSLVEDNLKTEMDYILQQRVPPLGSSRRISATMTLYHANGKQQDLLPAPLRGLPPGTHEVTLGKDTYHLYITPTQHGHLYIIENATEFEKRENALHLALSASVAVSVLVALWLSIGLSTKVITPLTTLAQQVARLKPSANASPIAGQYANDEVGQLAATFDDYLQQMEQFIRREQEFTADASHELRTPLAVIQGASELLSENPALPERARGQLDRISRAGERMSQMLESLLLLARETAAGDASDHAPHQIEELVMEVVEQHRHLAREKSLELRCEILRGFSLNTSRTALSVVLSNLLRNAIHYTHEGSVVVRVNDGQVAIIDSGIGIDDEELPHIFDRHYRGRNAGQEGSGIGLSIVKRICDRQHWQIHIDSAPEKGTTVTLSF